MVERSRCFGLVGCFSFFLFRVRLRVFFYSWRVFRFLGRFCWTWYFFYDVYCIRGFEDYFVLSVGDVGWEVVFFVGSLFGFIKLEF